MNKLHLKGGGVVPNKVETDLKVNLKMMGYKNDMGGKCYTGHTKENQLTS